MKKFNWKEMGVEEISAAICKCLHAHNIKVTLCGGACVTIYSDNQYKSGDLDFVMTDYSLKEIDPIMEELGFIRTRNHRHYENPECPYFVEFPPGPLTIGEELVKKRNYIKTKYGELCLLTPTDSVKDRLAAFYHWNDRQSLEQAALICKTKKIDLKEVERWSKGEGSIEKYKYFLDKLK